MIATAIYLLASLTLGYSGFCRLVRTDVSTTPCIRIVFWLLTVAAMASSAAVLLWNYHPGWPAALLATCMAAVQMATALLWRDGVPKPYRADGATPGA